MPDLELHLLPPPRLQLAVEADGSWHALLHCWVEDADLTCEAKLSNSLMPKGGAGISTVEHKNDRATHLQGVSQGDLLQLVHGCADG